MKQTVLLALGSVLAVGSLHATTCAESTAAAQQPRADAPGPGQQPRSGSPTPAQPPKVAVLNIELTGDTGGPKFTAEHEARLRMETDKLRHELELTGLYRVLDLSPAQPSIARLTAQHAYLHDCNGCDLEIGKQLGADQTLVTWVDRVSGLILSLSYEFHDVASGQIVARKSYDFRGDNDAAWTHAITRMVRDLKEASATSHKEQ